MEGILEGLLFISGDDGLKISEAKKILEVNDEQINFLILNCQDSSILYMPLHFVLFNFCEIYHLTVVSSPMVDHYSQ